MWIDNYLRIYEKIGLPRVAIDLASGKIPLLSGVWETLGDVWGFPPALLPLWSDGSLFAYQGYWKHWFCNRDLTIVEVRSENGLHAIEIARNIHQLTRLLVLYGVVAADGIDDEVRVFCQLTDVDDADKINQLSIEIGDFPEALKALPTYINDLPARVLSLGDSYNGDFPFSDGNINGKSLRNYCLIEFPHISRANLSAVNLAPEWLKAGEKGAIFDKCMDEGDLLGAWMSLNSNGWNTSNAKNAMWQLANASHDDLFKELADAWLSAVDEEFISY